MVIAKHHSHLFCGMQHSALSSDPVNQLSNASPKPAFWRLRDQLLLAGRWCAVLSLFAAPVNKPATAALVILSLLFSLSGTDVSNRWRTALGEPVVTGFLVWFMVLFSSAMHSTLIYGVPAYRETALWSCIYPALMASLLPSSRWRWRALWAFAIAAGLVVLISYLMQFGLVPQRPAAEMLPSMRNTVFKEYTQQGLASLILMSMLLAAALKITSRRLRTGLLLLAAAVLLNVVVLVQSRTTFIVLLPLMAYWIYRSIEHRLKGWRPVLISLMLALASISTLWSVPNVRERMVSAVSDEVDSYLATRQATSSGIRIWLWQHTLPIIADAPVIGHGLNRWKPVYLERMRFISDSAPFISAHPHQELLLILAEEGIAGLTVFVVLLFFLCRYAAKLPDPQRGILTSILIIYFTAGLANGLWSDFTHRNVFILLAACIPASASATGCSSKNKESIS